MTENPFAVSDVDSLPDLQPPRTGCSKPLLTVLALTGLVLLLMLILLFPTVTRGREAARRTQ